MKKRMTLLIATLLTATMLLSVVPVVNAANINETETQPTTVVQPDEPVDVQPTTINLKEKSKTLYIKGTYSINPNVVNAVGDTVFVSNDNSVATVDNNGVVTAKKKGNATISVTNNGVVAQFKVVVKEPTVNLKKGKTKNIPIGTSFTINIKGKVGNVEYKVSNNRFIVDNNGKLKAKKPGKATITIKTNGLTIKRKIKSTLKLKISYDPKKKVKINVGQNKKIRKLYKYTTNLAALKKYVSTKKYKKFKKQVDKKAKSPKAKIKNTKVAKVVDNKVISGKKKGKTKVVVSCGKQSFDVGVDVTKLTETTFKGEKAKVAYSAEEAYQLYKKPLVDSYIKGEKPDYRYIQLAYATNKSWDKVEDEIDKIIAKNYDNNDNFYTIIHQFCYCFNNRKDNNNIKYMDIDVFSDKELKEFKKLYNAAKKILDSININSFKEDYEKIAALHYWFNENCTFGDCAYDGLLESEKTIIYKHKGVCTDHALATNYFCALLKIPSINNNGMVNASHEWNYIKIGSKWYHTDNLNGILLVGSTELAEWNNKFKCFGLYDDEINRMWNKRISKTSFEISKEKRNEILTKMGYNTY